MQRRNPNKDPGLHEALQLQPPVAWGRPNTVSKLTEKRNRLGLCCVLQQPRTFLDVNWGQHRMWRRVLRETARGERNRKDPLSPLHAADCIGEKSTLHTCELTSENRRTAEDLFGF